MTQGAREGILHLGRNVLSAQLGLHMGVVELADEGVGPGLAGVDGHVHVILTMPLPPLLQAESYNITLMVQYNKDDDRGWAMQG